LTSLWHLAEPSGENWWKDLLKLWRPSGSTAEDHGLRLAVRNNYLNFYSKGQAIARVGFNHACQPYLETHVKYAFGPDEEIQACARLEGTVIRHPNSEKQLNYNGESTLREWIDQAQEYAGTEKQFVDKLVADNPAIIDLEIALPARGVGETAPRMDCAGLEREGNVIRIVFWEAKMIGNGGLKSLSEPAVVRQVRRYHDYLNDSERAQNFVLAYRNVCCLLQEFRKMADVPGRKLNLDQLVSDAGLKDSKLEVDPEPRIIIFGEKTGNWLSHEKRLWKIFGIRNLVFEQGPYPLSRPAMTT
jgi:hypothetical protein